MEITSPTAAGPTPNNAINAPTGKEAVLSSDFETFLKMLTTQMKNQDPLNPVESADFAVQLATFSNVEQQVLTNDLLSSLGDRLGAIGVAQLSGWVGMEARAHMPVPFDGTPVPMTLHTSAAASSAQLVVTNSNGIVVARSDVPAKGGAYQWSGEDGAGIALPSGTYSLSVESFASDTLISEHPVEIQARIVEARSENGATVLVMANGQELPASQILGLRESNT